MRTLDENSETVARRSSGSPNGLLRMALAGFLFSDGHGEAPLVSVRRRLIASAVVLVAIAAISCSPGTGFSPAGAQEPTDSREVTVPDNISGLDSEEVERRLGRLLGEDAGTGQGAPGLEPTTTVTDPTLEEILNLLNSANPVPASSEIVISVSPATLSLLTRPVLTIKSPPAHGSATVISANQILYTPDGSGDGNDSFEYELFDGDLPIISQLIEVRS